MPPKTAPAAPADEPVVLKDGEREALPPEAAEVLERAGEAVAADPAADTAIVLLKPVGEFTAGRVIVTPFSLATPLLADGSARVATAADQEIAWPHVERVNSL